MTHLRPEELLDVAEGTRAGGEFPHLHACSTCARQVADLRAALGVAAEVSVPDPSPLFWDHLSTRVRESIAEERAAVRRPAWIAHGWWWRFAAAAVVVLVVAVGTMLRRAPVPVITDAPPVGAADLLSSNDVPAFDEDPALALLADLTSGMDWEAATEAGLVPAEGAVDSVVFALSAEERVELQRLLQEALAASGA